jgi:hypothetical protein
VGSRPALTQLTPDLGVKEVRLDRCFEYGGIEIDGARLLSSGTEDVQTRHG